MKPTEPTEPSQAPKASPATGGAGRQPAAKGGTLAQATASLAPFNTHFAHRPDWRTAADDEADAQRDGSRGG